MTGIDLAGPKSGLGAAVSHGLRRSSQTVSYVHTGASDMGAFSFLPSTVSRWCHRTCSLSVGLSISPHLLVREGDAGNTVWRVLPVG